MAGQKPGPVGPEVLVEAAAAAADQVGVVVGQVAETGVTAGVEDLASLGLAEGLVIAVAVSKGVAIAGSAGEFRFAGVHHVETAVSQPGFRACSGVAQKYVEGYAGRVDRYLPWPAVAHAVAPVGWPSSAAAKDLAGRGESVAEGASC